MLITTDDFYAELDSFRVLPEQIHTADVDSFKRAYGQESAGLDRGIVYVLRSQNPIPRLKGESDVVYIGMTAGTSAIAICSMRGVTQPQPQTRPSTSIYCRVSGQSGSLSPLLADTGAISGRRKASCSGGTSGTTANTHP